MACFSVFSPSERERHLEIKVDQKVENEKQ